MKTWTTPEIKDLAISDTEYFALKGTYQDGVYTSNDGKYVIPTYSGEYDGTNPFKAE